MADRVVSPTSIEELEAQLAEASYFAERSLATAIFLALRLGKPLFLEGDPGVGKTQVAKVLAEILGTRLIRLQCYEGLDVSSAVYEWDYSRQLLEIRLREATGTVDLEGVRHDLFRREFLLRRPLLEAIDPTPGSPGESAPPPVLLIDELDRADEELEAYLLELLSDFQITVPELGTVRAESPPVVVLTSNRTREVHDALRRRCLYHWIDDPSFEKEHRIVVAKVPEAPERLAREVVAFVQSLRRDADLYKRPGVAETLDWMQALVTLHETTLTAENVRATLGALLKYQEDVEEVAERRVEGLLEALPEALAGRQA